MAWTSETFSPSSLIPPPWIKRFVPSKGEAKRLIEGGGVSIEDKKITDPFGAIPQEYINKGEFVLHKGKKVHIKVMIK